MGDWNLGLGTLEEETLAKLADMLDNSRCGWRQLAAAVTEQPRFRYSEKQLMSCSLQVLSATGSPSRVFLAMLADHDCSLDFLLHCLRKMEHRDAVLYLTATVTKQIRITLQPLSQCVPEAGRVVLHCMATGPPGLGYQWFKGKDEVPGGCTPELVLSPLTSAQQGHYTCRIHQGEHVVFSQWARVCLAGSGNSNIDSGSKLYSASGVCIIHQPQHTVVAEGDTLRLECVAQGNPPPQYQWYINKQPIPMAKQSCLKITGTTTADRGQYSCRVYNLYHEIWSDKVNVNIGPGSCDSIWDANNKVFTCSPARQTGHFYATDKVALLIGNMNYQHHRRLRAPMADVHELTNLLRQLDFKVVSLLDLNQQEMHSAVTEFLLLLDRGMYGLLYFAGHGYENYGNSFMVPVDAPASYTSEHCLWVQEVLQRMQERRTGLNIFLLDMCRKRNLNDGIIQHPEPLKVTANIVFGYATCVDAEAYEVNKDDLSNGIFMRFLKTHLLEEEKVTVMLDRVAEDMGQCELTRGRQALELRSNLSERRALTDRIQGSTYPVTSSARNLQWAIAHVLPESRSLQFDCGVRVQLGFAAEFSNIMVMYTRILEKPKDISSCSALLSDFSEGLDVDLKLTNQESPQHAGSWLLTSNTQGPSEFPTLYTRFRALQKLKKELTFTVCLQYQYSNMDDEVQERQKITVGKPLVAKLNLHEPRFPRCSSSAASCDLHSFSLPESTSFPECLDSNVLTSENSALDPTYALCSLVPEPGEIPDSTRHSRVNEPEETFSPEFLEVYSPQALPN